MQFPAMKYRPLPLDVAEHAKQRPDHVAVIDGDETIDYATLDNRVRRGAATLIAANVGPADRVLVATSSKSDLLIGVLAGMAAGAAVLPLSLTEESLEPVVQYFKPKVVVLERRQNAAATDVASFPIVPIEELSQAQPVDPVRVAHEEIGLVILTSGTTQGQRRGALLSHRSLCGSAQYMNERMGIDGSVRDLVTAPLEHGFGMGRARCALHAGGTVVFQSGLFSPRAVIDEMARRECNMLSAAVSAIVLLLENEGQGLKLFADRLRWLEMGTGYLKPAHRLALTELMPRTRSFMTYGLTEAIRCTFLELNADRGKIEGVGKPTPWVRVRIVDEENAVLPPGVEGRIQVDGVNKASGYFGFDAAWEAKQIGEWLDTGDRGILDADGYLTFVGRSDDMINVGGLKVAPEEIETLLAPVLAGRNFSVARVADPNGIEGFVPALFLEASVESPIGLEQVRKHLRQHLPEFKIPRVVHVVDRFPRTAVTQKVRRSALTEFAAALAAERTAKTTTLASAIAKAPRQNWPAVVGSRTILRRQVTALLNASPAKPNPGSDTLSWLPEVARTDVPELAKLVGQLADVVTVTPNAVVALGADSADAMFTHALALKTLSESGAILELQPLDRAANAEDLGQIRKFRARYVVIDNARLKKLASAERHLWDTFDYPEFERVYVLGDAESATVAQFKDNYALAPYQLFQRGGGWRARRLDLKGDAPIASEELWKIIRSAAAKTFELDESMLQRHSTPDTTPGWNSLGFMRLIAAVEDASGAEFSPREIMTVRQLGDLVKIASKASGV